MNKEIRINSKVLSLQLDYNLYTERSIDEISKNNITSIEYYTLNEYTYEKVILTIGMIIIYQLDFSLILYLIIALI